MGVTDSRSHLTAYLLLSASLLCLVVRATPVSGSEVRSAGKLDPVTTNAWERCTNRVPFSKNLAFCDPFVAEKRRKWKSNCHFPSSLSSCTRKNFAPKKTSSPPYSNIYNNCRLQLYRPQDSLVAGIAEISMGCSLGVLWSEYAIATTGCGPNGLSDGLERFCYQGVIVAVGMTVFNRIVMRTDLARTCLDYFGALEDSTVWQVRAAEWSAVLSVLGAFIALGIQWASGASMDGLSGIDVGMCRAMQQLR